MFLLIYKQVLKQGENMSLLNELAHEIYEETGGDVKTVAIDPATIFAIIGVITQVIKLYQDCQKTPVQAQEHMSSIGWWNRRKLWRVVKSSSLLRNSSVSAEDVYDALLNRSAKITAEDVKKLYSEVK